MYSRSTFNPYAAGAKRYGLAMRSAPNVGKSGDLAGYKERDNTLARRKALLRRLKAQQQGKLASPDALRQRRI